MCAIFYIFIVWTPPKPYPPPPHPCLFLKGGVNFDYLPFFGRGESEKLKKAGGSMNQGQVFLKGEGGWHFSYFTFSRFIIFTFRNYVMYLKKLCYAFLSPSFYEKRLF